ncbi:LAETG motif-containing sortase-dependent surface protein [Streptomyces eurocidicus]|uniref:LPXTG-motif cell wall-anchored protein n=1 Tax=Streptomyces eurocidicus TaxID=66423 RepID=A0A7W8BAZ8_STREU|nr:LAETG motif-containing sortase-dependent surface protein [Streptomyces eurocidicus]MBB5119558.1 LPXTG-motif cell wall-anchored protein [Streptomyces eurocidicus]
MKLRRALATAAVTAAIAPAALLAAPAAYAVPAAPAGSVDAGSSGDTAPATSEDSSGGGAKDPSAAPAAGKAVLPVPAADDKNPPSENPCKKQADSKEKRATTELIRFPDKVVAGADPQEFFLRATNSSKDRLKSICLHVDTMSWVSDAASTDSTEFVTLEWQDPKGTWQPITNKRDDSIHFGYVDDLPPDEYTDAKLRLKVDGKAKAGAASTYHSGIFAGKDDVCGKTEAKAKDSEKIKDRKTLQILPADTQPGKIDHSKSPSPSPSRPGGGAKSSASPSPSSSAKASSSASPSASASASASSSTGTAGTTTSGGTTTGGSGTSAQGSASSSSANGELATTGSSSSTPVIAGLAGAAVVAGGAAVAVTRRRKNNT